MYDNHTPDQLRDALALCEEQRKSAVDLLDSVRSELRIEKERTRDQADMIERQRLTNNVQSDRINALIREKTDAEVKVEDLQRLNTTQMQRIETLMADAAQARERHDSDIARIGERLIEEAESRGWCSEFDEIVDELNGSLHVDLPRRVRDYEVTVPITVSILVTVTARDEDEARENAEYNWADHFDFREYAYEAIREGNVAPRSEFDVEAI